MKCEPANIIIQKLGGLSAVASIVGISPHSVMRWRRPKKQGGTGGGIPHWHVAELLSAAKERGVDLSAEDFFPAPEQRRAS